MWSVRPVSGADAGKLLGKQGGSAPETTRPGPTRLHPLPAPVRACSAAVVLCCSCAPAASLPCARCDAPACATCVICSSALDVLCHACALLIACYPLCALLPSLI